MSRRTSAKHLRSRLDRVARQLATGTPPRDVIDGACETWGLNRDDARALVSRGHAELAADMGTTERPEYLASRLAVLDRVIAGSLLTKNWGQATAAVKAQLDATGLGKGVV
ncbi:hypothetical protein EVJ50_03900 [Synechococcus sp. RSCCF101]|uniref:hypothetical protein n=1 Tax=Synechococcus sp. RSCCF101 TaxID=2511069 RepID=UPI00124947E5|nr:hypothetical protein [Synechococcus sp. RSCCF101]QEY31520.1 hypothetical protein EVJ50_03900 [Synechococcus sp. RSCCF101]